MVYENTDGTLLFMIGKEQKTLLELILLIILPPHLVSHISLIQIFGIMHYIKHL